MEGKGTELNQELIPGRSLVRGQSRKRVDRVSSQTNVEVRQGNRPGCSRPKEYRYDGFGEQVVHSFAPQEESGESALTRQKKEVLAIAQRKSILPFQSV